MSIVDFKSMKHDKELFDNMADKLIKDTLNKKKEYATLYNKANMLKNEINQILLQFDSLSHEAGLKLSKNIHDYSYSELEELLADANIANIYVEKFKILLYKIKLRLDEINQLRTKMIKLDLYENHSNDMEDDTLDEEYIDMDKIREERGINLTDKIDEFLDKFDYDAIKLDYNDEYYEHRFEGNITLKMIANEMYGNPSYWVYIYNYDDNIDVINKIMFDNNVDLETFINNPSYLNGVKLKLPKEIEFYSDEFNTTTLKKVS